jgi:diguanylate cyclase (GGDEF)-like protein
VLGPLALLDAMPDATAVLDENGVIVAVNRAWRMFAVDNGGQPESTGIGIDYLQVCARSALAGCEDAAQVEIALRAVLQGSSVEQVREYPCPSPSVGRWFLLRVTPIGGTSAGALVSHTNITRQKMAELDLERRASHDPLTGLANREQFTRRVEDALAAREGAAGTHGEVGLLYLDLDRFKPVNDTFGHAAGDELLQIVAGRLLRAVRPQDTAARVGGDEFAVVAPRIRADGLARLMERLSEALTAPYGLHGQVVSVGVSVGSCLARPGEGPGPGAPPRRRGDVRREARARGRLTAD